MSGTHFGPTPLQVLEAAAAIADRDIRDVGLGATVLDIVGGFAQAWAFGNDPRVPPLARIPALTFAGVRGDSAPAIPLCGIAFLLYLGIDILDDLMDGDETPYWQRHSKGEALLLGATLISAVPQLAISRFDAPLAVRGAMQETLASGLLGMAAGQRADILGAGCTSLDPGAVEASVVAKSGTLTAMLAVLGAQLAGACDEAIEAYRTWGLAYGAADQIRSDCAALFHPGPASDLRNGTVTYPLACLLEATPSQFRADMQKLLRDAVPGTASRLAVRGLLLERGAMNMAAVTIGWHIASGRAALGRAAPTEGAHAALKKMLDQAGLRTSLLQAQSESGGIR